jgi:hypothetical protein
MRGTMTWPEMAGRRLALFVVVGAVVAGIIASSALATNAQFYAASSTPASVAAGADVVVTIRNCRVNVAPCTAGSNAVLGSAKLTLPAAAGLLAQAAITSKPSGKSWTASVSGNVVKLAASTDSSRLAAGESVSVKIVLTKVGVHTVGTNAYYYKTYTSGPGSYSFVRKGSSPTITVTPGPLARFALGTIPNQVAGTPFPVTATAYDAYDNLKTNYAGAAALTGTLDPSSLPLPGGTAATYVQRPAGWSGGSATWDVTAFKAQTGRTVTVADGAVTKTSAPPFTVAPGPLTLAFSPFATTPGLVKLAPAVAPAVTVTALDGWGNPAADGTPVTVGLTSPPPVAGELTGTTTVATSAGVAVFGDLGVGPVADGYVFTAQAPGAPSTATSGPFNVSNDVAACFGSSCSNSAALPTGQTASTSLTAGGSNFNGEYLLTTFSTDPLVAPGGACDGLTSVGSGGDIAVTGGSPTSSQPTFVITLTIPAALLDPSKAAWRYNVCLGAKSFSQPAVPWKTKKLLNLFTRKNAVPDGPTSSPETRYWGIVPRCIWVSGDPSEFFLNFLPVPSTNPCIVSKSRPSAGSGLGDLTIVLRKPYPWDGRWGIGG